MKPLKLMTLAILISGVFFLTSGALIYLFNKEVNERSANAFQESSVNWAKTNIHQEVKDLLAFGDFEGLRNFAKHYINHPSIHQIIIEVGDNNDGNTIFARSDDKPGSTQETVITVRQVSEDIDLGDFAHPSDLILGKVHVTFSGHFAQEIVDKGLKVTATITILAAFIMTLSFYFAIRTINKHLNDSNKQAKAIGDGDFTTLERTSPIVELNENAKHLNRLAEKLDLTIDELKSTSAIKSKLISMASHDLRQPLNSIVPKVEMLRSKLRIGARVDDITYIQFDDCYKSIRLLSLLMEELSDYNMIKSGKLRVLNSIFVAETVFDVTFSSISQNHKDNVSLNLVAAPSAELAANCFIETDKSKLTSIILNLLDNAFKYTKVGAVTLKWGFRQKENNTPWLVFEVIDTGPGIPEDIQAHIFDEFYQADTSAEGWGLGLPKVSYLVELLKGTLEIDTTLGEGSSFKVEIPVKLHGKKEFKSRIQIPPSTKVMVVDDNIGNCAMMKELLEQYGADVTIFTSPTKALEAAISENYMIAFIDYCMPEMNGVELAEAIRIEVSDMYIVCVTGFDEPKILEEIKEFTSSDYNIFNHFIRKPIDHMHIETILSVLSQESTQDISKDLEFDLFTSGLRTSIEE